MQKWEHLVLRHGVRTPPYTKPETIVNGDPKTRRIQTETEFYDFCNQLGGDGWELVGIAGGGSTVTVAFKRPKE